MKNTHVRCWKDYPDEIFEVISSNNAVSFIFVKGNNQRRLVPTSLLFSDSIAVNKEDKNNV